MGVLSMTKFSAVPRYARDVTGAPGVDRPLLPAQRDGNVCNLYAPGHQLHYRHQNDAARSPSRPVTNAILDGTGMTLVLEGGDELSWWHHDPERLRRMLDLVPGHRVAHPDFHALRIGPYWFNTAEADDWHDCRLAGRPRRV